MGLTETGSAEKSSASRHAGVKRWLVAVAFLVVGLPAAWHVSSWPTRLRYPGELDDIEGMRLAEMQHLGRGVPIYAPATPGRFDPAIYGPLYYLLGARLINPNKPAYLPLRLLSLLCTLGCAGGCALLAFWLSRNYLAAAFSVLLFFSYEIVSLHGLSARSDLPALLLVFSGFLVAYRFRHSRLILWAVPLMLAGLFYKQQFVAAPVAVFIFLILEKRYRLAAQFAGLMMAGGLGLLAIFHYVVFAGQDFFLHIVTYNLVPFDWGRFLDAILGFGVIFIVPVLVGFEFLRRHPNKLVACYLGCLIAFTVFLKGKVGSDTNYFIEPILILSFLFGSLLAERIEVPSRTAELLVLALVTMFVGTIVCPLGLRPDDFQRDRAIQDFLRRSFPPGTKALGHYTGDLIRAGLETPISDIWQHAALVKNRRLSDEGLGSQIRGKCFGVIVLTYDLKSVGGNVRSINVLNDRLRRAILENYRRIATLPLPQPEMLNVHSNRFDAWVPRPQAGTPVPASACD
jgi:hypothetical protein